MIIENFLPVLLLLIIFISISISILLSIEYLSENVMNITFALNGYRTVVEVGLECN